VRVHTRYRLELHLDTDEASAAGIKDGESGNIIRLVERRAG